MSAVHTPGPWGLELAPSGAFDITKDPNEIGRYMVIASRGQHEFRAEEMRANARLIAAAPELYDAVEMALNTLIGCCVAAGGVDDRKTILETQAMLREVIHRVIGGTE